ncbi:TPA: hypothetical protein ACXK4S_000690 [Pseudomonas aeruginosa]
MITGLWCLFVYFFSSAFSNIGSFFGSFTVHNQEMLNIIAIYISSVVINILLGLFGLYCIDKNVVVKKRDDFDAFYYAVILVAVMIIAMPLAILDIKFEIAFFASIVLLAVYLVGFNCYVCDIENFTSTDNHHSVEVDNESLSAN